jgi:Lectin C-type domain
MSRPRPLSSFAVSAAALALVLGSGVWAGCGSERQGAELPAPVIAANVRVIPDEIARLAVAEAGRLTFPLPQAESLRTLASGDVIVAAADAGFLRKVQSVSVRANEIVIEAPQAALTDAILEGGVDAALAPEQALLRTASAHANGPIALPTIDFDAAGKTLFEAEGARVVLANAHVTLHPSLEFGFTIRDAKIAAMNVVMNGELETQAALEVTLARALSKSGSVPIWQTAAPLRFVQFVGAVPIVEMVTIAVDARYAFEADSKISASAGAALTRSGAFGVRYASDGRFSVAGSVGAPVIRALGPAFVGAAKARLRVELVPRIEVRLYGVAGPALSFAPATTFTQAARATNTGERGCTLEAPYALAADVSGLVELDASVYGRSLANWKHTLFDVHYPIASGDWAATATPCGTDARGDAGAGDDAGDAGPPLQSDAGMAKVVPGCAGAVYAGHTYSFCKQPADWMQARARCTTAGADLASIADAAENAFVARNLAVAPAPDAGSGQASGYYIGLTYDPATGRSVWVDGKPASYFPWAPGEPTRVFDGVEERCAMTFVDGTWNDVPCTGFSKNAFVCESK